MFNAAERMTSGEPQYTQLKIIRRGIEAAIESGEEKTVFNMCVARCDQITDRGHIADQT